MLNSVDALHGDLGIVNDGDVILALSYSGESEELLNLLPALKRFSVKIISLTGDSKSSLARHSDVALNVRGAEGSLPVQPRADEQHHGDAGAWATRWRWRCCRRAASSRRILPSIIRPARLAARCCSRVGDIMRTGERNAVAGRKSDGQGSAARDDARQVRQPERRERARQTRRACSPTAISAGTWPTNDNLLAQPLEKVMTRNPICIRDDALAVEALKIFNERNIDDLIVVNAKREPVGLVDSQDLPKLKIM